MLGPTTWAVEKRGSSTVKRGGVPHDLDAQVPARDEPAAEDGHPRDGLALAQAGQRRVRFRVELVERQRRAQREPPLERGH